MSKPTVSKLPELVILYGPLPTSKFLPYCSPIFHANVITGNIWPKVLTHCNAVNVNTIKIKLEVLELKKMTREKSLLMDDLNFKIDNMVDTQLSMNPRPNITSYNVCMEDGGAIGQKLGCG